MVKIFTMLTLSECRECLTTDVNGSLSDTDVITLRDELQALAEVLVEFSIQKN